MADENVWDTVPEMGAPTDDGQPAPEQNDGGAEGGAEGQQGTAGTPAVGGAVGGAEGATPQSQGLSPEQVRDLIELAKAPTQGQAQQRQWTQEEFDQAFKVAKVTPEMLASVGITTTPEGAQAFGQILQAAVAQANTMAQYMLQQQAQRFQETLAPLQQHYQAQREQQYLSQFLTEHPDMQGFEPLLNVVYQQMIQERWAPAGARTVQEGEAKAFEEVYRRAAALKARLVSGNGQQQGGQRAPQQGGSRPSTVSAGGQGGAGPNQGNVSNDAKFIFG